MTAVASHQSTVGSRQSAVTSRQSAVASRQDYIKKFGKISNNEQPTSNFQIKTLKGSNIGSPRQRRGYECPKTSDMSFEMLRLRG